MPDALFATMIEPPRHLQVSATAPTVFLIGTAALALAAVAVGARRWRRDGDPTLLMLVLGGAVASLYEPVIDVLGHVYFVEDGVPTLYTAMDRGMPFFVPFAYAGYLGITAAIALRAFERGVTRRQVFAIWAAFAAVIIAFETGPIVADVYVYYGHQPLDLWGYPLWWAAVNPLTSMSAAAVVHLVRRHRGSAPSPAITFAAMAVAPGISNGVTSLPMWYALYDGETSAGIKYLAAAVTIGLSLAAVRLIADLVSAPDPVSAAPDNGSAHPARVSSAFSLHR